MVTKPQPLSWPAGRQHTEPVPHPLGTLAHSPVGGGGQLQAHSSIFPVTLASIRDPTEAGGDVPTLELKTGKKDISFP